MRQREIGRAWATGIGLLLAAQAAGAAEGGLTVAEAVRLGREQSPAVTAARARLAAGKAGVRAAGAPLPLQAELAPGVGFTNGNAFLSRPFDLAGRRTAQRRVAEANRAVLAAEVDRVELVSAADVRLAYAELVRAEAAGRAAGEAVELAREIRDRVARRVELGEAARVQLVRAEIELVRVEQDRVRALGEGVGRRSGLNLLLGRAADAPLTPVDPLVLPEAPAAGEQLLAEAARRRPELAAARARAAARRGEVDLARAQGRPELHADLAADFWSLDREPFRGDALGFQARLSFPLLDRSRRRAEVDQAQAGVREQEAEVAGVLRTVESELRRAAAELTAAREVVLNYRTGILPRSEELLTATQRGFEAGLSSFLEVLEAQRVYRTTRAEYGQALFEAVRAGVVLDRLLGNPLPGRAG